MTSWAELSWAKLSTYWAVLHYVKTIDGSVVFHENEIVFPENEILFHEIKIFFQENLIFYFLLMRNISIYAILSLLVGLKKSLQR